MDWLSLINTEKLLLFTLVLTRVSGLVITAPLYGNRDLPAQVRLLLAVAIAVLVAPTQWTREVAWPQTVPGYVLFMGGELMIGALMGLGVSILFLGIQLSGEFIGQIAGLQLAEMYDPSLEANVPAFSRVMHLTAITVFVCIGGHRMTLAALIDTFEAIPPGGVAATQSIVDLFLVLVAESFSLGIRAAAPVMVSLLLATLVLGLVGRTLPQLNAMILGFGLNALITFAGLAVTMGAAVWAFQDRVAPVLAAILDALRGGPAPPGIS